MLTETDKYLISGIRAGDYQAFETLFNSYYKYLVKVARFYVNSDEIAEVWRHERAGASRFAFIKRLDAKGNYAKRRWCFR